MHAKVFFEQIAAHFLFEICAVQNYKKFGVTAVNVLINENNFVFYARSGHKLAMQNQLRFAINRISYDCPELGSLADKLFSKLKTI